MTAIVNEEPRMSSPETDMVPSRGMLIDGKLVSASDHATLDSENPTTERKLGEIPNASPDDVDHAVQVARRANVAWRALPWLDRAQVLHEYAQVVEDNLEELARLDVLDAGLVITSMRADVASAVREIRYFAGLAGETKGRTIPSGPGQLTYTEFLPYPVVGRIVPFNHPLKFIASKISAPLAAGACVVAKPGEQTSLSALRLAELVRDVFPPGVLNIVTGSGSRAGQALAAHPLVPRIAFTGSVSTGARIAQAGSATVKHLTLELGGKNPFVVFPDADPARAARAAVDGMNFARSVGQSCGSTSRIFVHESLKAPFLTALVDYVNTLKIGDPFQPDTNVGPVAFREHYKRVMHYIELGKSEGATLVCGGGRPSGYRTGFFIEPTVFADVDMTMTIAREEIFGPVVVILDWHDYEDMLEQVNMLPFGLTGTIWTNDINAAIRTARRIESGYVSINSAGKRPAGAPFGGFKSSGLGKEGSLDELRSYGREQSVTVTLL